MDPQRPCTEALDIVRVSGTVWRKISQTEASHGGVGTHPKWIAGAAPRGSTQIVERAGASGHVRLSAFDQMKELTSLKRKFPIFKRTAKSTCAAGDSRSAQGWYKHYEALRRSIPEQFLAKLSARDRR